MQAWRAPDSIQVRRREYHTRVIIDRRNNKRVFAIASLLTSVIVAPSLDTSPQGRDLERKMRPPAQFGADITNQANNEPNLPVVMHCTRMAGRAIIRVVGRCNDAQENNNLDLSECQLMQVPDAVYHLMRHTTLKECNLSSNVISKIPPKFAIKFSLITDLNLSHNQMSKLPDELADLAELERLDISHNAFITLPNVVYKMRKLQQVRAHNNHIVEVEVERLRDAPALQEVDLQENPLNARCHGALTTLTSPRVRVSVRQVEDWEDLNV